MKGRRPMEASKLAPLTEKQYIHAYQKFSGWLARRKMEMSPDTLLRYCAAHDYAESSKGQLRASVAWVLASQGRAHESEAYRRAFTVRGTGKRFLATAHDESIVDTQIARLKAEGPVKVYILAVFLLETGLRITEAASLRIEQIDEGMIEIAGRVVPVREALIRRIISTWRNGVTDSGLLFPSPGPGREIPSDMAHAWNRKTLWRQLSRNGMNPQLLRRVSMTRFYRKHGLAKTNERYGTAHEVLHEKD